VAYLAGFISTGLNSASKTDFDRNFGVFKTCFRRDNVVMEINKIVVIIALFFVLLLGFLLGFNFKSIRVGEEPVRLNFLPKSCIYNGKNYKSGESFPAADGYNTCFCRNGEVGCTLIGRE